MHDDRLGAWPDEVARELLAFSRSAELLSRDDSLVDEYEGRWVGVCGGEVVASGRELVELLAGLDEAGVSRSDAVVRFIEREKRTLIL